MKITPDCVVGLSWTLKDTLGETLDELDESVEFLLGGEDLLAKIEQQLQGHEAGEKLAFQMEPDEAFGDYDENLVFLEPCQQAPARTPPKTKSTQLPRFTPSTLFWTGITRWQALPCV